MNYLFVTFAALIGLMIGSFLNCLAWRLYKDDTILGRSYCPKCSKTIAWYDNIPLLSFAMLGGRCRHCKKKISYQYPLVEFLTAILFALVFLNNVNAPNLAVLLVRDWLLISTFVLIFIYDLRWQMVPMLIVWPMILVAFVLNLLIGFSWQMLVVFGIIGVLFFLIQYLLTKGKGLGEGDIWLGLLIGVSFPELGHFVVSLFIAYFVGSIVSMCLLLNRQKKWTKGYYYFNLWANDSYLVFKLVIELLNSNKFCII